MQAVGLAGLKIDVEDLHVYLQARDQGMKKYHIFRAQSWCLRIRAT